MLQMPHVLDLRGQLLRAHDTPQHQPADDLFPGDKCWAGFGFEKSTAADGNGVVWRLKQ